MYLSPSVFPSISLHLCLSPLLFSFYSPSLSPSTTHLRLSLSLPLSPCLFPLLLFFPLSLLSLSLSLSSLSFFLSVLRSIHGWDPDPSFPQPLSLTRPQRPTPTNQICNLIQLHQQKRRRVTLLISRLLEGGEEKMKIDFVLLLIRKIETLHLRSTEQHVVGTDVGSLHSCMGRGVGACKNVPKTASFLSCGPRPAVTPGLMIPWENKKPEPR